MLDSPSQPKPRGAARGKTSLRAYARWILRFGSRPQELGILLGSVVNIALLLSLFGVLTTIASKLAVGDGGAQGFVPDAVANLPISGLMGLALALLVGSFAASLLLRLWITAEAYRMLERATRAAYDAIKREVAVSDLHLRTYPTVLKTSVRFMSVAYLQGIALLFPVFLVLSIVGIGLLVEPILTAAIAGAALLTIPLFLWQSRYAQDNSERLVGTLASRSAHINRFVTNLFHHPNEATADELSIDGYLKSDDGHAFRASYIHRQRVGAYSTAVSTVGTIVGVGVVFLVLLYGGEEMFNLPNLVLGVLLFRVLESNIGSLTKLLGNLRATVPFTRMAVELFERDASGFPDAPRELPVRDRTKGAHSPSPIASVVLSDLPWTRSSAHRITRAVLGLRGTPKSGIVALTGDFDLVSGEFADEVGRLDVDPTLLDGFETLDRAAAFLQLAPDARTQEAWSHLSPKGRFVLTAFAAKTVLEDKSAVLALNATDVGLLSDDERALLPWLSDRFGTVLIYESIPFALRLPESLDLFSFDGELLTLHGSMARFDDVIVQIYSTLVMGLSKAGTDKAGKDTDADMLASMDDPMSEALLDAGEGADLDAGVEDNGLDTSSRRRVGYAREVETTVWYERWLMSRRQSTEDPDVAPSNDGPPAPDTGPAPNFGLMSVFGTTTQGRAERERQKAADAQARQNARDVAAEQAREKAQSLRDALSALKDTQTKLSALETRSEVLVESLTKQLGEARTQARKQFKSDQANLARVRRDLAMAQTTVESLTKKLGEARTQARKQFKSDQADLARVSRDLVAAQTKIDKLSARLKEVQSRSDALAKELKSTDSRLAGLKRDSNKATILSERREERLESSLAAVGERKLDHQRRKLEAQIAHRDTRLDALADALDIRSEQLRAVRQELAAATVANKLLKRQAGQAGGEKQGTTSAPPDVTAGKVEQLEAEIDYLKALAAKTSARHQAHIDALSQRLSGRGLPSKLPRSFQQSG